MHFGAAGLAVGVSSSSSLGWEQSKRDAIGSLRTAQSEQRV